jgi:heme A synthase
LVDVHLTHRLFVYLATVLILWLVAMAIRRRPSARLVRMAWVALGMLALQLVVGALNVWLDEIYEALVVLHLLLATVLWGHLFGVNLQLYRVAAPAGVAGPALGRAETAAA